MGKTCIKEKFHRNDLVICDHSRDGITLSYCRINTLSGGIYIKKKKKQPGLISLRYLHGLKLNTVEFQCLEHLWSHGNMSETGVVRANECQS